MTGANGFVGQVVWTTLVQAGLPVRAVVRSLNRVPVSLRCSDVVGVGNIGPDTVWDSAVSDVDTVVHLAGRVHVLKETFEDPQAEFHKINVLGTAHLARQAASAGVRRLIYISSIGVNGRATQSRPFTEEPVPAPHNPYAISKWEAERILQEIAWETGLEVVILRPPLVYGPGVKANFLRLMQLADRGLPLPLGSVRNRRSLLYVRNLADAISVCIDHPRAPGGLFLVSDGEDVSTPELIRHIANALQRPVRLLPFPPRLLYAASRLNRRLSALEPLLTSLVVDSSKIRNVLDWKPPYSMKEGLKDTAVWFTANQ